MSEPFAYLRPLGARSVALVAAVSALVGCGRCGAEAPTPPETPARANQTRAAPPPGHVPDGALAAPGFELVDQAAYGPAGVRLLFGDADGHGRVCDVFRARDVGRPFNEVRCRDLDPTVVVPADARLTDAVEANAPLVLELPGRGLVGPEGARWTDEPVLASVAVRDGVRGVLVEPDGRLSLSAFEGGRQLGRSALPAVQDTLRGRPVLAQGHLYWVRRRDDGAAQLVRLPTGETDSAPEALADAPADTDALRVCRTSDEGFVLEMAGRPDDEGTSTRVLWFPGTDEGAGPATQTVDVPAGPEASSWTCRPGEATYTWVAPAIPDVDPRLQVHQTRCRRERCQTAQQPLAVAGADPVATDLSGRVLVAWTGDSGTRARLGPLVEIDRQPDLDAIPAAQGDVLWRRWVSRTGGALLLEGRSNAVRALRVTSDGQVTQTTPNL